MPAWSPNRIDRTDLKILNELQRNGRMTNVELSSRVGISSPACLRRVRTLEKDGVITGYRALINELRFGYTVTIFVEISLEKRSADAIASFEHGLSEWDIVRESYRLTGESDYLLKCVTSDLATFQEFAVSKLTADDNITSIRTIMTAQQNKQQQAVPLIEAKQFYRSRP